MSHQGAMQNDMRGLSQREVDVVRLLILGNSAKHIAMRLGVSHRTVEAYIVNIKHKLKARNVVHLVAIVMERDLLRPYDRRRSGGEQRYTGPERRGLL